MGGVGGAGVGGSHHFDLPGDKVGGLCSAGSIVEGNKVGCGHRWFHSLPIHQLAAGNTENKTGFMCL